MMFVDASVVVAVLGREPGFEEILNRLAVEAGPLHVSPLVRFEATVALARKKAGAIGGNKKATGAQIALARAAVAEFIAALGAEEMPISSQVGELAIAAAMTYGKAAGHAADLNFGACFAHACAKAIGGGLLYQGNDFALTDLA
ncbi:MAG: type II toxin-antitoxin system VapC family toxin [Devosia sp.]